MFNIGSMFITSTFALFMIVREELVMIEDGSCSSSVLHRVVGPA